MTLLYAVRPWQDMVAKALYEVHMYTGHHHLVFTTALANTVRGLSRGSSLT
jgi:hypothetical protein